MQLKAFLSTLIVLPALVSAQDGYALQTKPGFTKRSPIALEMQPLYLAKRGIDTARFEARALLQKRQCPAGTKECTGLGICCGTGTTCGVFGGEKGCCPTGKTCTGVENCPASQVDCKSFCCPSGSTCGVGANGLGTCNAGNDNGECGVKGFSPCKNMDGCCPTGVECVPPNKCNVKCTAADPKCGDGCCLNGSRCTADFTCAFDGGSGDLTSISATRTTSKSSTRTTSTSTRSTGKTTTNTLDANADSTTDLPTETQSSSTRRLASTSITTVVTSGNAAATGSVDSLLGLAAGIVGYLAL